jgi:DNA repair exonuclease SbcCD ATPase subunit
MDLQAALAAIQNCDALPNRADIYAAVSSEIGKLKPLEEERTAVLTHKAEILNEKKKLQQKFEQLQKLLEETVSNVAEGETVEEKLSKIKDLTTKLSEAEAARTTAETKLAETEAKMNDFEKGLTYQRVAAKVGTNADALATLINLPSDRFLIEDNDVFVLDEAKTNKKPLREHAQGLGSWVEKALFPVVAAPTGNDQPPRRTPSAPPTSSEKPTVNANTILASTFTGPPKKKTA